MPRESIKAKTDRTAAIIYKLQITYPNARCELTYSSPLELLIATILSAQCTDKQVNIVTSYLFKKYRAASDYIEVHLEELQNDIKRIGLFRNKSKSIQKCDIRPHLRRERFSYWRPRPINPFLYVLLNLLFKLVPVLVRQCRE